MTDSKPTPVNSVIVTENGVTLEGTYFVQNKMIYVRSLLGTTVTQLGGTQPEMLAKLLLSELVRFQ
jgi:hypothetical protein